MNRLVITRSPSTDQGTPGTAELYNPAGVLLGSWCSLELPWRNNAPDVSCIPPGVYTASLNTASHFGYPVYLLQAVPNRSACEIHDANVAGDVTLGYRSDLEGCTALGTATGELYGQTAVLNSDVARKALMAATGGADIEVEYRWASQP